MTFEEYATERLNPLFRFAAVLTGDRGLAEDIVQEVLIKVHARWEDIATVAHRDAYVRRMVVNEYVSWRRKWARIVPVDTERLPEMTVADFAEEHSERDLLVSELAVLPMRQRTAIVLRYYEGLSFADIGVVMGCRPATARGHVSRALAALRISPDRTPDPPPTRALARPTPRLQES